MNRPITSALATVVVCLLVACGASSGETFGDRRASQDVGANTPDDSDPPEKTTKSDGSSDPTGAPGAGGQETGDPGTGGAGGNGQGGQDGQGSRVAVNEHCCFNGEYLRCPDANACLGGFDLQACLQGCSPSDPCFAECLDKVQNPGPPVGCDANATPPSGVDCANGRIDL